MKERPSFDLNDTKIAFQHKSDRELLQVKFLFNMMKNPSLVGIGSKLMLASVRIGLPGVSRLIEATIFKHFCGGTTLLKSQKSIDELYQQACSTILDYGAEAKDSEEEFNTTLQQMMNAIDFASSNASVPVIVAKITGLGSFSLLKKKQSGQKLNDLELTAYKDLINRVRSMCTHAHARQVGIMLDAEESWIQDEIDIIAIQMMADFNRDYVTIFNTYQMYRKDKLTQLKSDHQTAKLGGYLLGAKLVRGAYMEKERLRAKEKGYPSPIHNTKTDTDDSYNSGLRYCVENHASIGSCNATHNLDSCKLQADYIDEHNLHRNHRHLNFCQLYGMSDHISFNLANVGFNVAKYLPYGPVKDIVPYLVRRAQENTSVTGEIGRELDLVLREIKRRKRVDAM